ncbi:MAG: DNA-J related domain-containing protein [Pseudomonadota bacterium]
MPAIIKEDKLAYLQEVILHILRQSPNGISEFELIKTLQDGGADGFDADALKSNLSMYQCHFILFHCLYALQSRLRTEAQDIDIHCLKIKLLPYAAATTSFPAPHDPLREYYLSLTNLETTTEGDVNDLLGSFWTRFLRNDQRAFALSVLGLQDPVSPADIRKQYKKLVMEHHPDRGGDKTTLQAINEAMSLLADRNTPRNG